MTAAIISDLQSVAPSSIIELFEVYLSAGLHNTNEVLRFHSGASLSNQNIIWAGNTYTKIPVEATGFEYSGQGTLPRPTIRVSNLSGLISSYLILVNLYNPGNDLVGAKLIRRRTLARFLDASNFDNNINPFGTPDSSAEFPQEVYYVDRKSIENRDLVEFELVSPFDLAGVRLPKRQTLANSCQWQYRDPSTCAYSGTNYWNKTDQVVGTLAEDVCGKRVSSCKLRFPNRELRFGSFPGIGSYR